ncbi:MAG: lamin tail domain-containing protein, partial [Candidatus Limnocylindrales bacterium]
MSNILVRRWSDPVLALLLVLLAAAAAAASSLPMGGRPGASVVPAADAPAVGLLVGEVVTGGVSAADEFVEIYNAAQVELDLAGLELVYVSSSGQTVTRKQHWTSQLLLGPGRHLLLANRDGIHATRADGLWSSGISSAGGSMVIRPVGGGAIDALSWGDAASAFREGEPGIAPPAGSSLERLPGGGLGNGRDTGDNASDSWIQAVPMAQASIDPPTPPGPVDPSPTPLPSPEATGSATPGPTTVPSSSPAGTPP